MRIHSPLFFRRLGRRLLVLLFGEAEIVGRCRKCGKCCRELVLFADDRWLTRKKDFERFVAENPEYGRLRIIGRDDRGLLIFRCTWLTDEGLCKDHENRMDLCREHPSETFYTAGAELSPYCGYKVRPPSLGNLLKRRRPPGESFEAVFRRARESVSGSGNTNQPTDNTEPE